MIFTSRKFKEILQEAQDNLQRVIEAERFFFEVQGFVKAFFRVAEDEQTADDEIAQEIFNLRMGKSYGMDPSFIDGAMLEMVFGKTNGMIPLDPWEKKVKSVTLALLTKIEKEFAPKQTAELKARCSWFNNFAPFYKTIESIRERISPIGNDTAQMDELIAELMLFNEGDIEEIKRVLVLIASQIKEFNLPLLMERIPVCSTIEEDQRKELLVALSHLFILFPRAEDCC